MAETYGDTFTENACEANGDAQRRIRTQKAKEIRSGARALTAISQV